MKAFILAGGLGTRLRPLTERRPKPLLPFANLPLARHTLALLRAQGITEFVFLLHYLPGVFQELLGDGSPENCQITYAHFSENLDTAGCLKAVEHQVDGTSLIFSGDIVVDFNLSAMVQAHRVRRAQITLAIRPEPTPLGYGIVQIEGDGRIVRFEEKPTQAELFSNWMNCGIYLVEPDSLRYFPASRPLSFEREVFPYYAAKHKKLFGIPLPGYWRDLGNPASYLQAHVDFLSHQLPAAYYRHAENGRVAAPGNLIGDRVAMHRSCRLSHSIIGADCVIEEGAELYGGVLWDGVHIGRNVSIHDSIIGDQVRIGEGARVFGQSLVAAGSAVPPGAHLGPEERFCPLDSTLPLANQLP